MKKYSLLFLLFMPVFVQAEIKSEGIQYQAGDLMMNGYYVYDDSYKGKRPGLLLVHEWWGLNDYIRNRARRLAQLGYSVMAVDMYGQGKTADSVAEAARLSGEVRNDIVIAKERFIAAKNTLSSKPMTDASQVAAIGYSFGGGVALQMVDVGLDLKGVVNFYGQLTALALPANSQIKTKLLVLQGEDDPFMPKEQIDHFKKEINQVGINYNLLTFPKAKHSFTNPNADDNGKIFGLPLAYNKEADERSWEELTQFLNHIFN